MNKLSLFAAIATLGLAAPAFAQTPSDIRNGRSTVPEQPAPEVRLDRSAESNAMQGSAMESSKKEETEHHGKHHHHHHHAKKHHHHAKKHHKEAAKKEGADKGAAKDDSSSK